MAIILSIGAADAERLFAAHVAVPNPMLLEEHTKTMNRILLRNAADEHEAWKTAEGMEDAGCYVFSVTVNPHLPRDSVLKWAVWGRYDDDLVCPDEVDAEIDKRLFPGE